jgi:hypothetical protein
VPSICIVAVPTGGPDGAAAVDGDADGVDGMGVGSLVLVTVPLPAVGEDCGVPAVVLQPARYPGSDTRIAAATAAVRFVIVIV